MNIASNKLTKTNNNNISAFTLVELSIVIVIISLLTAGIFSGQKLVQQSKLQGVIKEIREYDTATHQFKDKFRYYPGDMPNAESYWGAHNPGPPVSGITNGNGNWQMSAMDEDLETGMFWRGLSLAGFISGEYIGNHDNELIGTSVPSTKFSSGGAYGVNYTSGIFGTKGNYLEFGAMDRSCCRVNNGPILSPADTYFIDTKIDDGLAAEGNFYAVRPQSSGSSSKCVSDISSATSATYLLSDATPSCYMIWWLDKNK